MAWLVRLAAIGALAVSLEAGGQSADDRELMQYRLTPEILTRVEAVATAFDASLARNPAMKRKLDAQREIAVLEAKDDLTEAEQKRLDDLQAVVGSEPIDLGINGGSLAEMSAQLSKQPAMAAALKSAGMAPRDMAKFIVTAVQASMIGGLQRAGTPLPPGAAGENVKFVMANQASIERINKLLGAR
jgi:hypothetical protein